MESCIYVGRVRHRRFQPRPHAFSYRLFSLYLDLDELDEVFRGRWLWSNRHFNLAWFRRRDHLGDPRRPLAEEVRELVGHRTGRLPEGPIRLLTHLRYFGYCFNPVSFYYCYGADGRSLQNVVAEVNNTPWGERHCYVLAADPALGSERIQHFRFPKTFHVSPFMGMEQICDWRLRPPGQRLAIHMTNLEGDRRVFDATLALERRPLSGAQLAQVLLRFPFMTGQVIAGIYWQALKLWLKGCPVYDHPKKLELQGSQRL